MVWPRACWRNASRFRWEKVRGTDDILRVVEATDPEAALAARARAARQLLAHLGDEARLRFMMDLLGETGDDKVSSLVHL